MQDPSHAAPPPVAGRAASQPAPGEGRPGPENGVVLAGTAEELLPAPEAPLRPFLLVLLRALAAWAA
jgi:hypothetical protein